MSEGVLHTYQLMQATAQLLFHVVQAETRDHSFQLEREGAVVDLHHRSVEIRCQFPDLIVVSKILQ